MKTGFLTTRLILLVVSIGDNMPGYFLHLFDRPKINIVFAKRSKG